jgi:2'-5' RNA ligase
VTSPHSVERGERLRLFCALRLPDDTVEEVVRWQREHLAGGRVVPRDNLHVTLAFLGSTPADHVPDVLGALRDAAALAGPVAFDVSGYRETRSAGMLALGDEGGHGGRLALDLHARLAGLGVYEPEQRAWLPHLTVVRYRSRPRLEPGVPALGRVVPSDAALYNSLLRSTGAQYVVMETTALGGS